MADRPGANLPAAVPLFPLPNVVLLPHAVLPLHIFEERYKQMTADVIRGHKQIAMALLRPGWEKNYYGCPAVEAVVCVGTILSHERLADGRYNFLLRGHTRARIVREVGDAPYRQAELEPLPETDAGEADLVDARRALVALFDRPAYAALPGAKQMRELLATGVPTSVVADLLAFNVLADDKVALKQELLGETSARRRAERVIEALAALRPAWRNAPDSASMN